MAVVSDLDTPPDELVYRGRLRAASDSDRSRLPKIDGGTVVPYYLSPRPPVPLPVELVGVGALLFCSVFIGKGALEMRRARRV